MVLKLLAPVTFAYALGLCVPWDVSAQTPAGSAQTTDSNGQPREFSGVWLVTFEGSIFIEGVDHATKEMTESDAGIWLNSNGESGLARGDLASDPDLGCYPVFPFHVTFVGQQRTGDGGYGHMGLWASEVDVHHMIQIEPDGSPFCSPSITDAVAAAEERVLRRRK